MLRKIKKLLAPLSQTPLHPQWLAGQGRKRLKTYLKTIGKNKVVLDVGCSNKWPQKIIPITCSYIGLDYLETAEQWYNTIPDIYGDACCLPIANKSIDVVLLFDVLEHIPDMEQALREIHRVLKFEGSLILQAPFLYPLHDEPRDYCRLTKYGFERLALICGYSVKEIHPIGHPIETSVLFSNISITKTILNWYSGKNPACLLIVALPVIILCNNLVGRFLSIITPKDFFMPFSYQLVLMKIKE